jgi:hypothetical protein
MGFLAGLGPSIEGERETLILASRVIVSSGQIEFYRRVQKSVGNRVIGPRDPHNCCGFHLPVSPITSLCA